MTEEAFLKKNKKGHTWKNVINPRGVMLSETAMEKRSDALINSSDTDANMSALYSALGFKNYIHYERV